MLFNSFVFAGFFLAVYLLYVASSRHLRLQNLLLLVASYIFYGWWDWRFLGLLVVSTLVDFFAAKRIDISTNETVRRRFLVFSIFVNLAILGTFKYFNFFTDSMISMLSTFGMDPSFATVRLILPVGISFYTFQSMGYTIDVYRRRVAPSHSVIEYALYVSFFPQLVAGPIERAQNLLPQFCKVRTINAEQVHAGMYLVLWGYFKKVVVADNLGLIADEVFSNPGGYGGFETVVGILAFTGQIYADFSGYSDIARGVSKLMGFELMVNFKLPYFARNPSEFWQRWHISLSTWIRDYLYIPLGGSRHGKLRTYRNLLLSMLLAGLWHGAGWNFIIWGAFHGLILALHRLWSDLQLSVPGRGLLSARSQALVQIVLMFLLTTIGWVIFRSETVGQAVDIYTGVGIDLPPSGLGLGYELAFFALPLVLVQFIQHHTGDLLILSKQRLPIQALIFSFFMTWIVIFGLREPNEFIYFQF